MSLWRVTQLVSCRGTTIYLSVWQRRSQEAGTYQSRPQLGRGVSFAGGRGSTHAFHDFERVGVEEGLRRARIQEGDTSTSCIAPRPPWILILVVKEESSMVTTSATI